MATKRQLLEALPRRALSPLLEKWGLEVADRRVKKQIVDVLTRCRAAKIEDILARISLVELKTACRNLGESDKARRKAEVIERLLEKGASAPPPSAAPKPSPSFDATASMLGYLYQARYALLGAIRRLQTEPLFSIEIETLDDVVFHRKHSATEVLQTKHHLDKEANLTDASPDLWKTLRIWSETTLSGQLDRDVLLYLLTTARARPGSIAAYLRVGKGRDIACARERLDQVSSTSSSESNASAYSAYQALRPAEKRELLQRIVVLDQSPDILDVGKKIHQALALSVEKSRVTELVTRLEGWWFPRVISHLSEVDKGSVRSEEVRSELDRIRDQFRPDNLPVDDEVIHQEISTQDFSSHRFVEQLRLVSISDRRMLIAMRNFYRASEHRSRWLRDGYLMVGDLNSFDRKLVEEWEVQYSIATDTLSPDSGEERVRLSGQKVYEWAESPPSITLRAGCNEPFVTRGSLQVLSDELKIGWHRDFLSRLGPDEEI